MFICAAPCHVAGEQHHGNGTTVITLKGRSAYLLATTYVVPEGTAD